MATHGRYTRILVDEFDFSGQNNNAEVAISSEVLDDTAFQDTARSYVNGFGGGVISQSGYFDGTAASGMEAELKSRLGTASTVHTAVLFGTDTAACPAYVLPGTDLREMSIQSPVNGLITLNGRWGEGTGIKRGIRAFSGTISATGGQTSIDLGADGAAGGFAYLFIQTITGGATDATITVESDNTDAFVGAETTECTFTFSAVGSQAQTMSGAVEQYVRLNCTSLGTATDFTVVAIICLAGVTY